jgi:hypothetical protein
MTEDESEIVTKSQEELLTSSHGSTTLFADDDPLRLKIADSLSKRYHFFHPMLEFIEVFWLRDGFDIICGNPPWLKLEFNEKGVISEKYPEIAIRKVSAPEAKLMRDNFFAQSSVLSKLYHAEEIETTCQMEFMNALSMYPLLKGQKNNLYKCVLANGFYMLNENGYMGLLHPETVYDDPKGQPLREDIYHRLRYHFQFTNEKNLFAEVHHNTKYGEHIYGSRKESIDFKSIHNLFHPSTIDGCFIPNSQGDCPGIKDANGDWNINSHSSRVVRFTEVELRLLSDAFEDGASWESVKLPNLHSKDLIHVVERFANAKVKLHSISKFISSAMNEAGAVKDKTIKRNTCYPIKNNYDMIYSGPHFYVCNPLYKSPREKCELNSDYDSINLMQINAEYIARTNYTPIIDLLKYKQLIKIDNSNIKKTWIDTYRLAFRYMLNQSGERTLNGSIIPPQTSHIHGVTSIVFEKTNELVGFTGLCGSLVMDYFIRLVGTDNLNPGVLDMFPFVLDDKFKRSLYVRTLLLNCLTIDYANLWQEMWDKSYLLEEWSLKDSRLKPFNSLHDSWKWDIPLRNFFERRQAFVEIDVIAAMALGLSLKDLEMIYTTQFPVLFENENDTWYDADGNIAFTCSKGLTGVGLDRKRNGQTSMLGWEDIRGEQIDENTYAGTAPTHTHTIDPTKNELYGGQQQTFVAPYNRCDRIADYRTAWAHFEKMFNK